MGGNSCLSEDLGWPGVGRALRRRTLGANEALGGWREMEASPWSWAATSTWSWPARGGPLLSDPNSNLVGVTDPLDHVTALSYDALREIKTHRRGRCCSTAIECDATGRKSPRQD